MEGEKGEEKIVEKFEQFQRPTTTRSCNFAFFFFCATIQPVRSTAAHTTLSRIYLHIHFARQRILDSELFLKPRALPPSVITKFIFSIDFFGGVHDSAYTLVLASANCDVQNYSSNHLGVYFSSDRKQKHRISCSPRRFIIFLL